MTEPQIQYFLTEEARERGVIFSAPRPCDAGFDLPALEDVTLQPGKCALVRTGVHLAIPPGWVGIVRDRSSVAMRGGVTTAGVIDAAYRGEVKVLMHNMGSEPLMFKTGDRVAQCIVVPHLQGFNCVQVETFELLGATSRGENGFGSTGR
jgi:dUTP pyrophosphatase